VPRPGAVSNVIEGPPALPVPGLGGAGARGSGSVIPAALLLYVNFDSDPVQVHVPQPGATFTVSGSWTGGPVVPKFSLAGVAANGQPHALDPTWTWDSGYPDQGIAGSWAATVRFYRTGTTDLTVTADYGGGKTGIRTARAKAIVTMEAAVPDLSVQQPQ